jgi:hypothetical protein
MRCTCEVKEVRSLGLVELKRTGQRLQHAFGDPAWSGVILARLEVRNSRISLWCPQRQGTPVQLTLGGPGNTWINRDSHPEDWGAFLGVANDLSVLGHER